MKITAKYGGKCSAGCGVTIEPGDPVDYNPATKTARHDVCPSRASHELADRLGFLPHAEAAVKDWTHD